MATDDARYGFGDVVRLLGLQRKPWLVRHLVSKHQVVPNQTLRGRHFYNRRSVEQFRDILKPKVILPWERGPQFAGPVMRTVGGGEVS